MSILGFTNLVSIEPFIGMPQNLIFNLFMYSLCVDELIYMNV